MIVPWSDEASPLQPTWSPDGTRIAFIFTDNSQTNPAQLYVVNADGTGLRWLGEWRSPAWLASDPRQSTDVSEQSWGEMKRDRR